MINRTTFFTYARRAPFGGRLSTEQVEGCEALLDACQREGVTDLRRIAYVFASVFHETGGRMVPVRETFATSDRQAMDRLDAAWRAGKLKWVKEPYWRDGWFGRGLIQLTHRANYVRMGRRLGVPLDTNPALALELDTGARIAVVGMNEGLFTGKRLADYFNSETTDPVGARRIVNGTDKAKLIAGYFEAFLGALQAADERTPLPKDISDEEAAPDDVPPAESKSLWSILLSFVTGGGGLAFLNGINSWPAVAALALLVVAGGIGAWLVLTGRVVIERRPQ